MPYSIMHDRRMLLSILCRLMCSLLGMTAVLVRRDLSKDAELLVLRHETAVLCRQIPRVRYAPADRVWLARVVPVGAAAPLGRGLPGYACHDPWPGTGGCRGRRAAAKFSAAFRVRGWSSPNTRCARVRVSSLSCRAASNFTFSVEGGGEIVGDVYG